MSKFDNLTKRNDLEFINKIIIEHDFYKADIIFNGKVYPDKVFFPSTWSREKVMAKIMEAYDYFKDNGAHAIKDNNKYIIRGKTQEGIVIEMYFTSSGEMKIAYPLLRI